MTTQQQQERSFRIGEVAERVGVTPRTIRYYEELGLLQASDSRAKGTHRLYGEAEVERLRELVRLRNLLGLSLEELVSLAEAEDARAGLRDKWHETTDDAERIRILDVAIPLVERQLELVQAREATLEEFRGELSEKLRSMKQRRAGLEGVESGREPGVSA